MQYLKELLKVKSIITIVCLAVFVCLTVTQTMPSETSSMIIVSTLTYYFVKKDNKE
jgi:hypothetical protein